MKTESCLVKVKQLLVLLVLSPGTFSQYDPQLQLLSCFVSSNIEKVLQ